MNCSICGDEVLNKEDIKSLPLYVIGSEGVNACLQCRIILTEVAKGMRRAAMVGRKQVYLKHKVLRDTKNDGPISRNKELLDRAMDKMDTYLVKINEG
jgi:hypothetical protein